MKLSEFRNVADTYTGKASEIIRQLILAGIGVIWLFKKTVNGKDVLDKLLIPALIALCAAALCDLLQYVIAGRQWTKFFLEEERKVKEKRIVDPKTDTDSDVRGPKQIGRYIEIFYYSKLLFMIVAYLVIVVYMVKYMSFE